MHHSDESIAHLLRSFLPEHLASRLAAGDFPPPGVAEELWAVTLFTDVAGFTPLSEMLTRLGKEGAERLMSILCRHFGRMVELIEAHGGSVVKYGGDAASVIFVETTDSDRSRLALAAVRCAWQMMQAIREYSHIPIPELGEAAEIRMKIGVSCGPIHQLVLGDSRRLEFVVAGRVLDRMAEAEHHAVAGQVVVDREIVEIAGLTEVVPLSDGFFRVEEDPGRTESFVTRIPPDLPKEQTAPFVHPMLVEQMVETGAASTIAEHRKVTILFVQFEGIDYDRDSEAFGKLQEYFLLTQEILRTYDGHLLQLATGDKGSVVFIVFGAPATYENDAERAVLAALELQERAPAFLTNQRIGINTGSAFCGNIGSPLRREYTTLGDTTNVAARLMASAKPRQILVSESTRIRAGRGIEFESLPSIRVKGKSHPLDVCVPRARGNRRSRRIEIVASRGEALVGRAAELRRLLDAATEAARGHGSWVHVEGVAGVGKSHLVEEFVARRPPGLSLRFGKALSFTAMKAWSVIAEALAFEMDEGDGREPERRRRELARLAPAHSALEVDLMGFALGWWSSEAVVRIPEALRQARIRDAFERLLLQEGMPTIVVVEDIQWLDPATRELLPYLATVLGDRPTFLLTTGRPGSFDGDWLEAGPVSMVELGPLDGEEIREVVLGRLPGCAIEPDVSALLSERSRGVPFFAVEIARELVETGRLLLDEASGRHYLRSGFSPKELPESVGDLVLAKLDRLPEVERQILRVAAVVGETFDPSLLPELLRETWTPAFVEATLERLAEGGFFHRKEKEDWRFDPPLLREVAYESLAFGRRRELHAGVAAALERRPSRDAARRAAELARHFEGAGELRRAFDSHREAVAVAVAASDNPLARFHLDRALDLGGQLGESPSVLMGILGQRAQVLARLGELPAAFDNQRRRYALASRLLDRRAMSEACFWMSRQQEQLGHHEVAGRLARKSLLLAEKEDWAEGIVQAAWQMATVLWRRGRLAEALEALDRLVEKIPFDRIDPESRTQVLFRRALVLQDLGRFHEAAAVLEECGRLAAGDMPLREPSLRVKILISSAFNCHHLKDAEGYARRLEIARRLCEETSDHRMRVSVLQNLGAGASEGGRFDEASRFYSEAAFWARRLKLSEEEANALLNEGYAHHVAGNLDDAIRIYSTALERYRELSSGMAIVAQANLAEARAARGLPDARDLLESTLEQAEKVGNGPVAVAMATELAKLHSRQGNTAAGREARERAIELADRLGAPELAEEARRLGDDRQAS